MHAVTKLFFRFPELFLAQAGSVSRVNRYSELELFAGMNPFAARSAFPADRPLSQTINVERRGVGE